MTYLCSTWQVTCEAPACTKQGYFLATSYYELITGTCNHGYKQGCVLLFAMNNIQLCIDVEGQASQNYGIETFPEENKMWIAFEAGRHFKVVIHEILHHDPSLALDRLVADEIAPQLVQSLRGTKLEAPVDASESEEHNDAINSAGGEKVQ
ncbi:hypothetical protein K503DRAFT_780610 [Rhizopogon vinicolor AM-OR11-026]|uniref:Uncharacterized protein n=1 Tax=Rhizopogon vinicolor AM-OR11-026 TaxID=1314800 RepID=A0A1B7N9H3_9AGAM|nr:hypothetical protein K503DRAFT_780610 [Rhizopogon vinicolor AM-OR11-026]